MKTTTKAKVRQSRRNAHRGGDALAPAKRRELVRLAGELAADGYAGGPVWDRLLTLTGGMVAAVGAVPFRTDGGRYGLHRLLACDYAERVLPVFERQRLGDGRPRRCIEMSRACARGECDPADVLDFCRACWCAATEAVDSTWDGHDADAGLRAGLAAWAAWHAGSGEAMLAAGSAVNAAVAADDYFTTPELAAVERRWQLCRAVEYRLGLAGW